MKITKLTNVQNVQYIMRHWGKWYVMLDDAGLVSINKWFKKADDKAAGK